MPKHEPTDTSDSSESGSQKTGMSPLRRASSMFRKRPVTDEEISAKIKKIEQLAIILKKFHDDINPNKKMIRERSIIFSLYNDNEGYKAAKKQLISALKDLGISDSKLEEIKFPIKPVRFDAYYELGETRSTPEYSADRNLVTFVLETLVPKYATPDRSSTGSSPPSPERSKHTPKA